MAWQVEALKQKRITKPVVAWVSGTCAKLFKSEVQFGHAGAKSGGQAESAQARTKPHVFRCHNLLKQSHMHMHCRFEIELLCFRHLVKPCSMSCTRGHSKTCHDTRQV